MFCFKRSDLRINYEMNLLILCLEAQNVRRLDQISCVVQIILYGKNCNKTLSHFIIFILK